jgi:hypothetical protein
MSQRVAARDAIIPLAQPATTESGEVLEEVRIAKGEVVIINTAGYNRSVQSCDKPREYLSKGTEIQT